MIENLSTRVMRQASLEEFEELLLAHQRPILLYIRSLVSNHHESEDLLQKTNLILWRKRESFEAGSNFRAWSFSIARLEVSNRLRQQRRDQRIYLQQQKELLASEGHLVAEAGDKDALMALQECLKKLPSRDKELLLMRYCTDRTLSDYARNLNRSPGTLKARLFKIRENLRKSIEDHLRRAEGARRGCRPREVRLS
jgi:RNA polymerase sigma-70 factor (ECF subfamily)